MVPIAFGNAQTCQAMSRRMHAVFATIRKTVMKSSRKTPITHRNAILTCAVSLLLCGPAFGAEADSATAADHSAKNARDRSGDTITPIDQSNSKADVDITRTIRKGLVDDSSLGINAQNVKIVTVNGSVTLRGPVASAMEQSKVFAVAEAVVGAGQVQNELEIVAD